MSFCSLVLAVLILEVRSIVGSPTMVQPSTSTISYQDSTVPVSTSATTKLIYSLIANNTNSREATTSGTTVIFSQPKIDTISTNTDTPTTVVTSSTTDNTIRTTIITEAKNKHDNLEYVPHKVLTDLEEKIQALSCDIPLFPSESRVWKGNETHELLLPITTPLECRKNNLSASLGISSECTFSTLIWEGSIEIRSGDVLLVRIDDSQLTQSNLIINYEDNQENVERLIQEPQTAVYQVTRTGYDNCDVMEGILLDITPLKVDNRKVVTLYDKDLTEGINLLIVVSELWGKQCIRLKVTVKSDNCGENEDCSGKGICYSNMSMEGYECQCCSGFVGPHCEEQDACYPSPCKNNGICVDISQGHEGSTFQCLCPYGYTGKTCEETTDPCTSMPCQNGATCFGNVTHFSCQCSQGFLGLLCQHNQNECESSPCVHGICVDEQDSYTCYCQPGYTGTLCELEYNECDSSPCLHGGTCTDRIDAYSCACPRGYLGKRCEIKACGTNPCTNGGTCWSSMDSFYCACKPGYTGKTCEDEFVVETIMDTDSISKDTELDLQMPISIHLDHLHNVYIAAGTLASAFVIVALIVTICYCRVNKTYKRFILRIYPFCIPRGRCVQESPTTTNSEWFSGKNKAPTATPSRNLPSLDTTDMYYTLDFSESQSSPLIQ